MTELEKNVRVVVVGFLAFCFLGFYTWFANKGLGLLATCLTEGDAAKLPASGCQKAGMLMGNALDLFSPVSGVVTAVALSALAYKPDAVGRVAESFIAAFLGTDKYRFLDIMIELFLVGWVVVGVVITLKTASLSPAMAKDWNLTWPHGLGRSLWATALTAVALWLGVPRSAPNPGPGPMPKPID